MKNPAKRRLSPALLLLCLALLFSFPVQAEEQVQVPIALHMVSSDTSNTRYFEAKVGVTFEDLSYYDYGNQYLSYHVYAGGAEPDPLRTGSSEQVLIVADANGRTDVPISVDVREFSGEELIVVFDIYDTRQDIWYSQREGIPFQTASITIHPQWLADFFGPIAVAFSQRPFIFILNLLVFFGAIFAVFYVRKRKLLTFH